MFWKKPYTVKVGNQLNIKVDREEFVDLICKLSIECADNYRKNIIVSSEITSLLEAANIDFEKAVIITYCGFEILLLLSLSDKFERVGISPKQIIRDYVNYFISKWGKTDYLKYEELHREMLSYFVEKWTDFFHKNDSNIIAPYDPILLALIETIEDKIEIPADKSAIIFGQTSLESKISVKSAVEAIINPFSIK